MQLKKKLNDKQVALNDEIFVGVQLLYVNYRYIYDDLL